MDQSAFRALLSNPRPSTTSTSTTARQHGLLPARSRDLANSKPDFSMKPRKAPAAKKEEVKEKKGVKLPPGYRDRAAERREKEKEGDDGRPRGLDYSLLDDSKRAALGLPTLAQENDSDVEEDLEQAYVAPVPVEDKKAKSRAEMLADLKKRMFGEDVPKALQEEEPSSKGKFKAVSSKEERKAERKKKKRKLAEEEAAKIQFIENASKQPEISNTTPAVKEPSPVIQPQPEAQPDDADDDDIFADAGEYDAAISDDEEAPRVSNTLPAKLFQEDSGLGTFQAYVEPAHNRKGKKRASANIELESSESETEGGRLRGLEGGSNVRDLLEMDNAAARDEKRKLKKLKGKERKEAVAAMEEREGKVNEDAKWKDKLNRDVMEMERYTRK